MKNALFYGKIVNVNIFIEIGGPDYGGTTDVISRDK